MRGASLIAKRRRSILLICTAAVLLVLAGGSLALYLREPPDPAAQEFVRTKMEAEKRLRESRSAVDADTGTDIARLSAQDPAPPTDPDPKEPEIPAGRREQKKKQDRKSKRDEFGVEYTEDGQIDKSKLPPMGG